MRKLYFFAFALLFLTAKGFAKTSPLSCNAEFSIQLSGNTVSVYPVTGADSSYSHYWSFGDLFSSEMPLVSHTYNQCGTYTIYHFIRQYNQNGGLICEDSTSLTITIVCNNSCIAHANFSVQPSNNQPENFEFINNSTISLSNAAVFCNWYFGDGSTETTNSISNISHTYTDSGTYNVCLIVTAEIPGASIVCRDTFCTTVQIQNHDSTACNVVASFFPHASNANPNRFEFTNTSVVPSNNAVYYWSFGDGVNSNLINPTHTFTSPGTYNICLTVFDQVNVCSDSYCSSVMIAPDSNSCNLFPDFEYSVNQNMNVHFSFGGANNFPDSTATITWNFGDNNTATGYSVNHEYSNTGTYLVCVTETLSNGCSKDTCKEIQVEVTNPNPCNLVPYFSYHNSNANPNQYEFIGMPNSLDTGMVIYWYFSDSSFATGHSVAHVFDQPGEYTACMNVVYNGNCSADTCVNINVVNPGPTGTTVIAYPNPAQNIVYVNLQQTQAETITAAIYNMQNVLVAQSTYQGVEGMNTLTFDISNLPVGIYTIRLYHGGVMTVARFQKL